MAGAGKDDDDFFDQLLSDAGAGSASAAAPALVAAAPPPALVPAAAAATAPKSAAPPALVAGAAATAAPKVAAPPAQVPAAVAAVPSAAAAVPVPALSPVKAPGAAAVVAPAAAVPAAAKAPTAAVASAQVPVPPPAAAKVQVAAAVASPAAVTSAAVAPGAKVPVAAGALVHSAAGAAAGAAARPQVAAFAPQTREAVSPSQNAQTFHMADDDEDEALEAEPTHVLDDLRPPEAPPPPSHFTAEDLALREMLTHFYLLYRPENLANLNTIVGKYRGRSATQLWASLALKYDVPPWEALDLLSRSAYRNAAYEYHDEDKAINLEEAVMALWKSTTSSTGGAASTADVVRSVVKSGADEGADASWSFLCFRGLPDDRRLRADVWKTLLGYLPMARYDEWSAIQYEKRLLYQSYRQDMLDVGVDAKTLTVKKVGAETDALQDLLQCIKNDVDRTRQDMEFFRRERTKIELMSVLFVYARLNPGVRYVQGMNEVAAVVYWVMSHDPNVAEADAFWVFSELMVEIKEGFMQVLDNTGEGVHGLVRGVMYLLRMYDPELARHLVRCELPPVVFLVRWCTVLFAQDASLPDVLGLWDAFIGDPRRFEFVTFVALAIILSRRDELLLTDKQFELVEVLQDAPRQSDWDQVLRKARAICAFERRAPTPQFPPPPRSQVVEDLSEWAENAARAAQVAAAKASVTAAALTQTLEESIAPAVVEKVGQAGDAVAHVAAEGAQRVQHWLEETAPARKEALETAQVKLTSLWDTVRTTSAVASQRLVEEYRERGAGAGETAGSRFAGISGAATSFWARTTAAAAAFAAEPAAGTAVAAPAPPAQVPVQSPQAAPAQIRLAAVQSEVAAAAPPPSGAAQVPRLITADAIPDDEV